MAARRAEPVVVGEIVVQVEVDRARQVARRPGRAPVAGPAEIPAAVDDPDAIGVARQPAHAARRRRSAGFGSGPRAWSRGYPCGLLQEADPIGARAILSRGATPSARARVDRPRPSTLAPA